MTNLKKALFLLLLISLSIGLLYFAYLGYYTRYWQDDWCYNAHFKNLGFLETIRGYFYITTYASNRFSLTLFSGIFYYLGVFGVQILPGLVILSFSSLMYFLIQNCQKITHRTSSKIKVLILSFTIVFFTIFTAPDRFQSFYWRSAILPYTFPLIFFILFLVIITSRYLKSSWNRTFYFSAVAFVSFFGTGFSEAGGAFFLTGLILVLFFFMAQKRNLSTSNPHKEIIVSLYIAIFLSGMAMIIMALSPANLPRQISYSDPSSFIETILLSTKFSVFFIVNSLKSYPLPHLVFFMIIFSVSFVTNQNKNNSKRENIAFLKNLLVFIFATLLLNISLHAPSAYIEGNPPAERTLVIARWIVLMAIFATGYFMGELFSIVSKNKFFYWGVLLLLFISSIYIIRAFYQTYNYHQSRYERIATVWDERDASIKSQKDKGANVIHVQAIDSQFLGGGILEWYPEPNWVNMCAAEFYQVKEIRATIDW